MAGDWIKWVKGLTRRREVAAVAHKLGISRREAAAACMELWEWADENSIDGHVRGVTTAQLDEIVQLPGFSDALADPEVGWLRCTKGGVSLPNFDRHNGETAKRRALNTNRKRRARVAPTSRKCRAGKVTNARPEKRREESIPPHSSPPSAPHIDKHTIPPPLDAVIAHGVVVGLPRDQCEKFHAYHESKGWLVGKSKMKDWHAAMRTWKLNMRQWGQNADPIEPPTRTPTEAELNAVLYGDDDD